MKNETFQLWLFRYDDEIDTFTVSIPEGSSIQREFEKAMGFLSYPEFAKYYRIDAVNRNVVHFSYRRLCKLQVINKKLYNRNVYDRTTIYLH